MTIKRVGPFIEFLADECGLKTLAKVNSVSIVTETDPLGQEVFITVANRTFRVGASLDEVRTVLLANDRPVRPAEVGP